MTSQADKKYIATFMDDVSKIGAIENVEQYRSALHNLLEHRKNREPLPEIGQYFPEIAINSDLNAAIAVPKESGKPHPVMLFCHGHGGLAGSSHSYRRHTHDMAAGGYLTITPNYRKAPEHRHPAGLDDMLAAAMWIKDHAADYGGDGSSIVIMGDSIGATMAAATMLRLLDTPGAPKISAFVGLEGFYERVPIPHMPFMTDAYMPEGYKEEDLAHPWVSPVNGFKEGSSYPPILLMTGSGDFAGPPTLQFALHLYSIGAPFQLHVIEDMPHDFTKMIDLDGYREGHQLIFNWLAGHR